jgi:hypothetical protein
MTGSLEQGLMMGLGAYGGAGLASGLAGTAANLAAPAAAGASGTAAVGADVVAQQAAAELAAQQAAAQAATTQAAAAANIAPPVDISGNVLGIDEMASLTGGQGVSQIAGLPPTGVNKFFTPDPNVTYGNIGTGFKNIFSSKDNFTDFVGDNKMNLAMSAAPMLITPEQEAAEERNKAMIRPYDYQVENLSGTEVDPFGTESERLRGRFVAREPYYAAQGGLTAFKAGGQSKKKGPRGNIDRLSSNPYDFAELGSGRAMHDSVMKNFAEGGSASGEASTSAAPAAQTTSQAQTPSSLLINLTPSEAEVYRNIFAVQQMAGLPLSLPRSQGFVAPSGIAALPSTFTMSPLAYAPPPAPAQTVGYTPSMVGTSSALDTSEKTYTAPTAQTLAPPAPPTPSNVVLGPLPAERYRIFKFAEGGIASLKSGGLREGAFIVPADVISHLGNGSSEAGMRIVQERLKGRPIKGPGDGMSDSIPTTIAGKQPARVANEEAEIPPEVVAALGGGSLEAGAKKLYEMMDKIRQDRTGKKKQAPAVKADKYMPA